MFQNLSLKTRLIGAFVVVSLISTVLAIVGITQIHKIEAADTKLYEMMTKPLGEIGEVASAFHRMRTNVLEYTIATEAADKADRKKRIQERRDDIAKLADSFQKTILTDEGKARFLKMQEHLKTYYATTDQMIALDDAGKAAEAMALFKGEGRKSREAAQAEIDWFFDSKGKLSKETAEENVRTANSATMTMLALAAAGVGLSLMLGFYLSFSISRSLTTAVESLSDGASQVSSASEQLSSSSQMLAEGSSEQAASLEETASAMEEMSAMTSRNTESAGEAKALSDRAAGAVDKANVSMTTLVGRMGEISSKGEEIGKIIKTIDEIAFQTNLLALNAAVEAARAGEAGAGFAVVADEVRNLAQRAAGAAKNTSDLIEGTIRQIQDGTQLVKKTSDDFQEVVTSVTKVTELSGEVAAASSEQARGITEVSTAVTQMDKVTQANAASAEEISSAAEEMNAQAMSMQEIVRSIESLVQGGAAALPSYGTPALAGPKRASAKKVAAAPKRRPAALSHAEKLIPMESDDMGSF
jgi:methyl-accepting chemotaxis protein